MSGDGKRGAGLWPQATAPIFDSTEPGVFGAPAIPSVYTVTYSVRTRPLACVLVTLSCRLRSSMRWLSMSLTSVRDLEHTRPGAIASPNAALYFGLRSFQTSGSLAKLTFSRMMFSVASQSPGDAGEGHVHFQAALSRRLYFAH
jgi:hypothetical protein